MANSLTDKTVAHPNPLLPREERESKRKCLASAPELYDLERAYAVRSPLRPSRGERDRERWV